MTSLYSVGIPRALGPMASIRPRMSAPNMAPGMLPMPPSTAAVKAFRPGTKPLLNLTTVLWKPSITPAAPARADPSMKVMTMTALTSTPISDAVARSSATARMARPSFVRWMMK